MQALAQPTLCAAFQVTAAQRPGQIALRTADGGLEITWAQYAERVARIAAGLAALGVERGDALALLLTNRPEFHLVDAAAMHLGAVPFSAYNTSPPEQVAYVVGNAGSRVIVTERAMLDRVLAVRDGDEVTVDHVVVVDGDRAAAIMSLDELEDGGAEDFDFEAHWRAVAPDDLLTLIYTSGTTGPPKGVEITHANMLAEWIGCRAVFPDLSGGHGISFLPAAHIADRWASHYSSLVHGLTLTCVRDPREVMAVVAQVHPAPVFGAVPRVWEKTKAALEAAIDSDPDEARRAAVRAAIEAGLRRVRAEQAGEEVGVDLERAVAAADASVFAALRERLGLDRAEFFVSGAAPIPVEVLEFFAAIGIPICELWGMSETSCVATCNPRERIRIGTVGPPLPGVALRLAPDGELLVRGPIVMRGYRGDPERTAQAIDDDGWLRTGDIGELDEGGYLRIVDRKKELIINAAGKNMSPANIEARVKASSPLVGQAIAIGDRRPYNVALLTLDPDAAAAFAARNGLADPSPGALAAEQAVREEVAAAIARANERLARVEQIKRWTILETEWEPGGVELTPTMKLKRRPIAERYAAEIDALYAG
jgi:long-chain acyl-CoA synthetase